MKLPKKYNSQEAELHQQEKWKDEKTYSYNKDIDRENTFVVDTPPPTVSGSLHIGHVFSYTQTDILVRYQRMLGKNIFYPMGWDDNGLPTERRVQNVFGVTCDPNLPYKEDFKPVLAKKDEPLKPISRKNFIQTCELQTQEDEKKYEHLWKRLGLSVDWTQMYETINGHSQKISQASFIDLVKKGYVYNKFSPSLWDIGFQTAVAQAEVEDREVDGFFYDIEFNTSDGEKFTISTTRPELLPACIAIVAHPSDQRFKHLFQQDAISPIFNAKVPILPSEHVNPEKGTGIMMVCTFGDIEDVKFWKDQSLPLKQIFGRDGRLLNIKFGTKSFNSLNPSSANKYYESLRDKTIKQARKIMAELLRKDQSLIGDPRPTKQWVKFYEKGDTPLELIPTRQWFIRILDMKTQLIEQGNKIQWHPETMRKRYEQWVEGLNQDWCISRQRYFGVPFPVWYPLGPDAQPDYSSPIYGEKLKLPIDPSIDAPPSYTNEQRNKANGFISDPDVMDTWATSSVSPQINSHWSVDQKRHQKLFPADLRPQAHEIIRTWAFYTIVKSWIHENSIPWKHIAVSGWVVDPNRSKMSKSKGNVIIPETLIDKYSADAIRYWAGKARLGTDTIFDENIFKIGRKLTTKLFNASKFVHMQVDVPSTKFDMGEISEELDKSWLHNMRTLVKRVTQLFDELKYAEALENIEKVFWNFCDNYLELTKARAYQMKNETEGKSAIITLDFSIHIFLKLFAPFLPFITEEIWSWRNSSLYDCSSVHTAKWPKDNDFSKLPIATGSDSFELAVEILNCVRNEKSEKKLSLATPLRQLKVNGPEESIDAVKLFTKDLMNTCKVSEDALSLEVSSQATGLTVKAEIDGSL